MLPWAGVGPGPTVAAAADSMNGRGYHVCGPITENNDPTSVSEPGAKASSSDTTRWWNYHLSDDNPQLLIASKSIDTDHPFPLGRMREAILCPFCQHM
eukprot:766438-Hanusia_phi.AAC.6